MEDLYNNKMVDMLDAIHDAGLKPIGIEPDLPGMHKYSENVPESDGLGLLNHGLKALTSNDEPALKEFFSSNETTSAREKLLSTMQQAWREYPGMAEKFMKVMDMAKESGYNASEFKLPLDEAETDRLIRSQQIWRDGAWADHIASVLSNDPQAKVVVYAGGGHFRPGTPSGDPTLTDALEQRDIASNSVGYAGADFPSDQMHEVAQNVSMVRSQLNIAAASATLGLSKQRFAIPVGPGANDWIIHLPQD